MTADEIASLFNVTPRAVRQWIEQGLPVESRGRRGGRCHGIDLQAAVRWWFARNHERLDLMRQQARLASEQAQKLAVSNRKRLAEVGERQIWDREVDKLLANIRATFLALPARLAPLTGGNVNQRKEALEAAVHEALRKLSHP